MTKGEVANASSESQPPTPATRANGAEPSTQRKSGLIWTVSGWLAAALALAGAVFYGLGYLATEEVKPWKKLEIDEYYDLARSTVAFTGLLGAAVAAGLATRRQRSHEESVSIAADTQRITANTYALQLQRADNDDIRDLRDRYGAAAKQLGDSSPAVQLAGVYAMAALVDDWEVQTPQGPDGQACIDVLCAFLRAPKTKTGAGAAADNEVRRTIVKVVAEHLQPSATTSWSHRTFDFTGAHFDHDVNLTQCVFAGGVTFAKVRVTSGTFDMSACRLDPAPGTLSSDVSFRGARFEAPAKFASIRASRNLNFEDCRFGADTSFRDLALQPSTRITLRQVVIEKAELTFAGTVLDKSRLEISDSLVEDGTISLFNVSIEEAGKITCERIKLRDGTLTLSESRVAGMVSLYQIENESTRSKVEMSGMTVDGGIVQMSGSRLRGDQLHLRAIAFQGQGHLLFSNNDVSGAVRGPWDGEELPSRHPVETEER